MITQIKKASYQLKKVIKSVLLLFLLENCVISTTAKDLTFNEYFVLSPESNFENNFAEKEIELKNKISLMVFHPFKEGNNSFAVLENSQTSFVIKIPKDRVYIANLEQELNFCKDHMGGILAPFNILKDVMINGQLYPLVVLQDKLFTFDDFSRPLPEYFQLKNGQTVDLREKEKEMIRKLILRGIQYPDALIPKNYGLDLKNGNFFLVDHGSAYFETKDMVFDPVDSFLYMRQSRGKWQYSMKTHDGIYFDKLGIEADDVLYGLWGKGRNKIKMVPDIRWFSNGKTEDALQKSV